MHRVNITQPTSAMNSKKHEQSLPFQKASITAKSEN